MAIYKLNIETTIKPCEVTGLNKKAVLRNITIDATGDVVLYYDEVWLGVNNEEVKVIRQQHHNNGYLKEQPDQDGDLVLSSTFKQDIETILSTLFANLLINNNLKTNL